MSRPLARFVEVEPPSMGRSGVTTVIWRDRRPDAPSVPYVLAVRFPGKEYRPLFWDSTVDFVAMIARWLRETKPLSEPELDGILADIPPSPRPRPRSAFVRVLMAALLRSDRPRF